MNCLIVAALLVAQGDSPTPVAPERWTINGTGLDVFTLRGENSSEGPGLLVFHGTSRNAAEYRDFASPLTRSANMLIMAPRFDAARFPNDAYHRGGLLKNGQPVPASERTWALVPGLVTEARRRMGRPTAPIFLIGHSAGGQFLSRLAAFQPVNVQRIIAANPGSLTSPRRDRPWPYGFGNLPAELASDEVLKRYLAAPLTLYLGTSDNVRDPDLDVSPEAMQQGANRFERGTIVFAEAEALAQQKGWPFNWKLENAKGIGHDAAGMFAHHKCREILTGLGRMH